MTFIARLREAFARNSSGAQKEKEREMVSMQSQLMIGGGASAPQTPTGSNTNSTQPSPSKLLRFAVPWVGQTRPVIGRQAKVLVYSKPITRNARGEEVFAAAILDSEAVTDNHRHLETKEAPSLKSGRILRVWAARAEGAPEYVTIEAEEAPANPNRPPSVAPTAKGLELQVAGIEADVKDLKDALAAGDWATCMGLFQSLGQRADAANRYTYRIANPQ